MSCVCAHPRSGGLRLLHSGVEELFHVADGSYWNDNAGSNFELDRVRALFARRPMERPPLSVISQANVAVGQYFHLGQPVHKHIRDRNRFRKHPSHFWFFSPLSPALSHGGTRRILCHTRALRANHISRYETKVTCCED